ncbi:hypothetical protein SUGI_0238660 [Cryptomeria japonica]|nr:hypothetical protein SUGI_0238660 [Cryptomeria japonica]
MEYDLNDWKMIAATCALITFMLWDIAVDRAKNYVKVSRSWWIPSNLFVLSSLTIQILGYVNIQKVTVFGRPNETNLEMLVENQLVMDAARLTMCVFVGCLLPGMAMAGTEGRWSNVAALFLTLFFQIATEIYALQNANNSQIKRKAGLWFVSSGGLLLLGASSLLLLLGAVILSGKLMHDFVGPMVSKILSKHLKKEGDRWENFRNEVMKSWVAARAWKTWYFICSSLCSPGAGMIVTICIVVMGAKVGCRSSLLHLNNGGNNLTFYLQGVFIFIGWILMLCRWFKAAIYCGNSLEKSKFIHMIYLFLVPAAVVVNPLCPRLAYFLLNPEFRLRHILISLSCLVPLLPLYVLILAISSLWLFCFICWYFSVLVFGNQFVQDLFKLDKKYVLSSNDELSKYWPLMADTVFEDEDLRRIFWIVNKKSLDIMKGRMDAGRRIRESCPGLLSLMGNRSFARNQRLQPSENSWMTTITMICRGIVDLEIGVDMEDVLKAFRETKDVFKFVDFPENIVVDPLDIFNTFNFKVFAESISCEGDMGKVIRKFKEGLGKSIEERRAGVERALTTEERARVDGQLRQFKNLLEQSEERVSNSLLIRLAECSYSNLEELSDILRTLVGHIIVSGLLVARERILEFTKQWAENMDEKKIERAIELAGMVSGLLEYLVAEGDILFTSL